MEDNAKCWSSATLIMLPAQTKHPLMQDLSMAQEAQPTTMWILLSHSLLPGRFGAYHTLHLDACVIQPGSSYRQCGEVCREPSVAIRIVGNQEAAARLTNKKNINLL